MEIRRLGAELFHADGHTPNDLTVAFRKSANAPKNHYRCWEFW